MNENHQIMFIKYRWMETVGDVGRYLLFGCFKSKLSLLFFVWTSPGQRKTNITL